MLFDGGPTLDHNDDETLNENMINDLVSLLESKRALCLVGSGLSSASPLKYPRWRELLDRFEAFAIHKCYCSPDLVTPLRNRDLGIWAQGLKDLVEHVMPGSYGDFVYTTFGPYKPPFTPTHEALVRLPFQHFLTTNYDPALEYADSHVYRSVYNSVVWNDRREMARFLHTLDVPTSDRKILHIHGRYNDIESIVLAKAEYENCYVNGNGLQMQKTMWGILAMKSFVFFGYGFNDDDEFTRIVSLLQKAFQQFHTNHFAFVGIDETDFRDDHKRKDLRMRFNREFGIQPIFYLVVDEDHGALDAKLQQIAALCKNERRVVESVPESSDGTILRRRMEQRFDYEKRQRP